MLTGHHKISALVDKETHKMKKTVRDLVPNLSERINQLVIDLLDPLHQDNPDYFIAKSNSPNQRGLVNELELVPSSSATTDISGSVTRPSFQPGTIPYQKSFNIESYVENFSNFIDVSILGFENI